jgi:hypothetical protein
MTGTRRLDRKQLKKDQRLTRDVRQDIAEETRSGATKPLHRQPNRDHARGDWDRSGVHHDEGRSRGEE